MKRRREIGVRRGGRPTRFVESSRGETAVDVIFQMCNGGLLAGNHVFHEVADRNHPDHFIVINDWQMTNVVVRH